MTASARLLLAGGLLVPGPALAAFGASAAGFHMLSFDAGGAARYSAHLPGADLSLLPIGTCGVS